MHRRTDWLWKSGVLAACILLLSLCLLWVPAVFAVSSGQAVPGSSMAVAQETPTEDPTVTALSKEQLQEQVRQLQLQNDRSFGAWLWSSASGIATAALATLTALLLAFFPFRQWLGSLQADRSRQAEELFQQVVTNLGSDKPSAQLGGAVALQRFLEPGYERFVRQVFELSVVYLQLQDGVQRTIPARPGNQMAPPPHPGSAGGVDDYVPPGPFNQALTLAFKRAFPAIRDDLKKRDKKRDPQFNQRDLDARGIHLENADLFRASLDEVWMPDAWLHNAFLQEAHLSSAQLGNARMLHANLSNADLSSADLADAVITNAYLTGADLSNATLARAILKDTDLSDADLQGADLSDADLTGATLQGVRYRSKKLNLLDAQGKPYTLEPTQWPQGFDPQAAGAICVDG